MAEISFEEFLKLASTGTSMSNVPDEAVEQIPEADCWAVSGGDARSWDFIVVKDPEKAEGDRPQ